MTTYVSKIDIHPSMDQVVLSLGEKVGSSRHCNLIW